MMAAILLSPDFGSAENWQTNSDWTYHHFSYLIDRGLVLRASNSPASGKGFSYGLTVEHHNGDNYGFSYLGTKVGPNVHWQTGGNWTFDFAGGAHNLRNYYENHSELHLTSLFVNAMAGYQARVDTKFQLRLGRDIIYKDWYDPMHAKLRLVEEVVEGFFDYNPFDLRTHGQLRRAWFNDGNVRDGYEGYFLYVLNPKPIEIRAGFGFWEVAYKERRWYWTPEEMIDTNLRFELELNPGSGWWALAKFYIGRSEERRGHPQKTSYQELRISRDLKGFNLGFYYCRWNAIGPDSVWWREDTGLTLSHTF